MGGGEGGGVSRGKRAWAMRWKRGRGRWGGVEGNNQRDATDRQASQASLSAPQMMIMMMASMRQQ